MKFRLLGTILLLFFASLTVFAQDEHWEPYQLPPESAQIRVWTSDGASFALVTLTFGSGGYRIVDWGEAQRAGNDISVNILVERWTGPATTGIVVVEHLYELGALAPGTYNFTVKSRGANVSVRSFDPAQVFERWEPAALSSSRIGFALDTVRGVTFAYVTLFFPDDGYRMIDRGRVERRGSETLIDLKLEHWTGLVNTRTTSARLIYVLGELPAGQHTLSINFQGTPGGSIRFNSPVNVVNFLHPIDHPTFFVRQQYLDFLNREPDVDGLNFWYNQITAGCNNIQCTQSKSINPSAAFFLSIEFQQTGYLVYRLHRASFRRVLRLAEFLPDTQEIGRGVVVGQSDWETRLETNKRAFIEAFVRRPEFTSAFPDSLTPEQYVDALNDNTASPSETGSADEMNQRALSQAERDALVAGLRNGTETRASVLRKVAEHPAFARQEFNRAFVLMQYFGYLRRNPDEAPDNSFNGYNFWLQKLNQFGGDFVRAEMVKAFITSSEYRRRFEQ